MSGMFEKENNPPSKQGVQYRLSLGKNDGPYLAKDIMHTNPRSIALLAGSNMVKSFSSLNQTLALCDTKQKEYMQHLTCIESVATQGAAMEQELQNCQTKDSKLKIEEMRLRHEFEILSEQVNESNNALLEENMPLLKGLYKVVREQSSLQREELFRLGRELKEMEAAKKMLLEGVFRCEERIIKIEKCFGDSRRPQVKP